MHPLASFNAITVATLKDSGILSNLVEERENQVGNLAVFSTPDNKEFMYVLGPSQISFYHRNNEVIIKYTSEADLKLKLGLYRHHIPNVLLSVTNEEHKQESDSKKRKKKRNNNSNREENFDPKFLVGNKSLKPSSIIKQKKDDSKFNGFDSLSSFIVEEDIFETEKDETFSALSDVEIKKVEVTEKKPVPHKPKPKPQQIVQPVRKKEIIVEPIRVEPQRQNYVDQTAEDYVKYIVANRAIPENIKPEIKADLTKILELTKTIDWKKLDKANFIKTVSANLEKLLARKVGK